MLWGVFSDDFADDSLLILTDSAEDSAPETDNVLHPTRSPAPTSVPGFSGSYGLSCRRSPRVTSGK